MGARDCGLAVQRERPGAQLGSHRGDRGIALGPIMPAAREQAHGLALPAHDQPIAVVLDLVHPVRAGRWLVGEGGDAGGDKSVGTCEGGNDAGAIAVSRASLQLLCCRCEARISISEIPKRNSTAKLIALMTAKGMFSRYRISPPSIETPSLKDVWPPFGSTSSAKSFRAGAAGIDQAARPPLSSFSPRATTTIASSASGRCSWSASSAGAVIQVSISSAIVRMTGIAFG
jgi:hypothetical protein